MADSKADALGIRRDIPRKAPRRPQLCIGRNTELTGIEDAVCNSNQSVGIFGMVGVGKETLAKEAFHRLMDNFREHGYSFVEIPNARLEEIREVIDRDFRIGLARSDYGELKALILLNDAVPNADALEQLLNLMPACALIVTSTEYWQLPDLYRVPLEPLEPEYAAEMFVRICKDRVALAPHHKRELIPWICESVGYLPLAIQIVANRVNVTRQLDQALVNRIRSEKKRLDELQCGHESIEASFNVSFAALPPDDQHLFTCLGAFAGSTFCCDAVNEIAGTSETHRRLVDLEMLFLVKSAGRDRFSQHPLLKSFARKKLDESGNADEIEARCAQFFFRYARHNRQPLGRLDRDAENILGCLSWAEKDMTRRRDARLIDYLTRFLPAAPVDAAWIVYLFARLYKRRGESVKALEYYEQSLAAAEAHDVPSLKGACLRSIGEIHVTQLDQHGEGRAYIDRAMEVLRKANDVPSKKEQVFTVTMLANHARDKGDRTRAMSLAEECLSVRDMIPEQERTERKEGLSYAARVLIESYVEEGNLDAAANLLERERNQLDANHDLAPVLGHVGRLLADNDKFAEAKDLFDEALAIFNNAENAGGSAWICRCRGEMHLRQRQNDLALSAYADALSYRIVAAERMKTAAAAIDLARVYHHVGDHSREDTCWKDFTEGYEHDFLSPETKCRDCVAEALYFYGNELLRTSREKVTDTAPMLACGLYASDHDKGDPAHIHHLRGDQYLCRGDRKSADDEYQQAVSIRKETEQIPRLLALLQAVGDTFRAAGESERADKYYQELRDEKAASEAR
ncbi:MAG: hypothetical protein HQ582_11345 [Planctomycetes bacterium]|nr:hypothetical protein [Planctomycetota bacterium]